MEKGTREMNNEYWLMALSVLQIADVLTTERILLLGGKELNPVMAYFFDKFGVGKALVGKAILVFCIGLLLLELMPVTLIFLTILYVGVVGWNSYQLWGNK